MLHRSPVPALSDVSFKVAAGSTVALVGESGSGKSVTSQAIMGILPRNARINGGQILYDNPETGSRVDIAALDPESREMRQIRGGSISIVFQEPMTSLSPVHTIGDQISEALFLHRDASHQDGMNLTLTMLKHVGFPDPERALSATPESRASRGGFCPPWPASIHLFSSCGLYSFDQVQIGETKWSQRKEAVPILRWIRITA